MFSVSVLVPGLGESNQLYSTHRDETVNMDVRKNALSAFVWVVKATVLAGDAKQNQYVYYVRLRIVSSVDFSCLFRPFICRCHDFEI